MPEISVNVEVFCSSCGAGMCKSTNVRTIHGIDVLEVEACDKCISDARDTGYEAGYQEAFKTVEEK